MAFNKEWVNTSDNQEWATPVGLFRRLDNIYHFDLDPCASDENHKCDLYFTKKQDGLSQNWGGYRVFLNPPYRGIYPWIEKAYNSDCEIVVGVLPAKTDAKWFHDFVYQKPNVDYYFLRHRLKYNDGKTHASFGSMIVIWRKDNWE